MTLKRDLTIAYRHRAAFLNPLLFFTLISLLFPLAITSDPQKLRLMGPGIIWIALLFANMLSIENIFFSDFEDGTLEQIALQPISFSLSVFAKLLAHWLTVAAPLLIMSMVLTQFFFLSSHAVKILFFSLLLGSPVLTFIGAIGAALTLGLQNRGIILILMVLPLYLPVLIFGAGAVNDASFSLPVTSQLAFLAAFLALTITFAPLVIASSLKISLE